MDDRPQAFWLNHLGHADGYNRWVFEHVARHLGTSILEVGCGQGTFTVPLAAGARRVLALDVDRDFVAQTQRLTAGLSNVEVRLGNIVAERWQAEFDTVVMLDVLEHIEEDTDVLRRLRDALVPGGRIILKVPAFGFLYGAMDEAVGHFRRYSKKSLARTLLNAGFGQPRTWYFNCAAMAGWWLNGKVLKRVVPPAGQIALFERVMPIVRVVDRVAQPVAGLSLFAVAQRAA